VRQALVHLVSKTNQFLERTSFCIPLKLLLPKTYGWHRKQRLAPWQYVLVYLLIPFLLKLRWTSVEKEESDCFLPAAAQGWLLAAPCA